MEWNGGKRRQDVLAGWRKREIVNEEQYRQEVRAALASEPTRSSSVLRVLNSPFTLWLLSSVVLSGLSYCWVSYAEQKEADRQYQQEVRRSKAELRNRCRTFESSLRRYETDKNFFIHGAIAPLTDVVVVTGGFAGTPLFPEFANRTAPSIVAELEGIVGESSAGSVDGMARILEKVEDLGDECVDNRRECAAQGRELAQRFKDLLGSVR